MNLKHEVQSLLGRVPAPPEETIPSGLSDEQIQQFEIAYDLTIPTQLRDWLKTSNGPCVGPGGIVGVGTSRDSQDAASIFANYTEWQDNGWFPLAGDGCGNYYVVATRNDFGTGEPVLFIDVNEDSSNPAFIAASDTWRFLSFLLRKELNETRWPYSKADVLREDPKIDSFTYVALPWEA